MKISDLIAKRIMEIIDESEMDIAEIQRNELANTLGCVPSQINYVLSSRFTPENGYVIESRRGGGGFVRIRRVRVNRSSAIMHIINSVGPKVDTMSARILLENSLQNGIIDEQAFVLMMSVVSSNTLSCLPVEYRDVARAATLKSMLLSQI